MIPTKARDTCISALKKGGQILMDHYGKSNEALMKESISSVVTEAGGKVTDIRGEEIQWNLTKNPCEKKYTILASLNETALENLIREAYYQ